MRGAKTSSWQARWRDYLVEYLQEVLGPSVLILPYDAAARWHGRARALLEKVGRFAPFADV